MFRPASAVFWPGCDLLSYKHAVADLWVPSWAVRDLPAIDSCCNASADDLWLLFSPHPRVGTFKRRNKKMKKKTYFLEKSRPQNVHENGFAPVSATEQPTVCQLYRPRRQTDTRKMAGDARDCSRRVWWRFRCSARWNPCPQIVHRCFFSEDTADSGAGGLLDCFFTQAAERSCWVRMRSWNSSMAGRRRRLRR
jgi:hypothetical protein